MKYIIYNTLLWYPLLCGVLLAQAPYPVPDRIFSVEGSVSQGYVADITPDKLRYKNPNNMTGPFYSAKRERLALVVYGNGGYMTFDGEQAGVKQWNSESNNEILLRNGTIIDAGAIVLDTPSNKIKYADIMRSNALVSDTLSNVLAIFYSDHKLPAIISANPLEVAHGLVNGKRRTIVPARVEAPKPPELLVDVTKKDYAEVSTEEVSNQALQKVKLFGQYIDQIVANRGDLTMFSKISANALSLFQYPGNTSTEPSNYVEVSTTKKDANGNPLPNKSVRVKAYLNRLYTLSYKSVKIEFFEVHFSDNLKKGADGRYYGTVTFAQRFTGKNDSYSYIDITTKQVEIIAELIEVPGAVARWMVYLGNIKVNETQ